MKARIRIGGLPILLAPFLILMLCISIFLTKETTAQGESPDVFSHSWGWEIGTFYHPDLVAEGGGLIFVTDWEYPWTQVFDSHGRPISVIDASGGITADSSGTLYVATDNGVQKFLPDGTINDSWGSPGMFDNPRDMAVSDNGAIYVLDSGNNRVQRFTPDGTLLGIWGKYGKGPAEFDFPRGIDVDSNGDVYVADTENLRLQKFSEEGSFIKQFGNALCLESSGCALEGIAVRGLGPVTVADYLRSRVLRYDTEGNLLTTWQGGSAGSYRFFRFFSVEVDDQRNVYISSYSGSEVQKYNKDGQFLTSWGNRAGYNGSFMTASHIEISDRTHFFVTHGPYSDPSLVSWFNTDGTFYDTWYPNLELGHYAYDVYIKGIAPDSFGNVYLLAEIEFYDEADEIVVAKFNANGDFLSLFGERGTGAGKFLSPRDIVIDKEHNVLVAEKDRIQKFASDGTFLMQWSASSTFNNITDLAVDASGNLYVVDNGSNQVTKHNVTGLELRKWTLENPIEGGWIDPSDILIDTNGDILLTDPEYNRLWRIDPQTNSNNITVVLEGTGMKDGEFNGLVGVASDQEGDIYILEDINHRIQKFTRGLPTPDPSSGLIQNGYFEDALGLVNWTHGSDSNNLLVSLESGSPASNHMVLLGRPVPQAVNQKGKGWLYQTIYVRPEWERPVLTFDYHIVTNDTIDYSDFYVWLSASNGAWLADILRDGYRSCANPPTAPPAGFNLGWRSVEYDLSAFKGENIRVRFENRNLHSGLSLGIWTYLDNVSVQDAGPFIEPSGKEKYYLPAIADSPCD